jgi:light-regulated signal transduction histidine kinase (bacteriophytochrome)
VVDLNDCEREPIHIPGAIQPFGVLLTLDEITRVNPTTKVIMFTATSDPATSRAFLEAEHLPSYQKQRLRTCCRPLSDCVLTEADSSEEWPVRHGVNPERAASGGLDT